MIAGTIQSPGPQHAHEQLRRAHGEAALQPPERAQPGQIADVEAVGGQDHVLAAGERRDRVPDQRGHGGRGGFGVALQHIGRADRPVGAAPQVDVERQGLTAATAVAADCSEEARSLAIGAIGTAIAPTRVDQANRSEPRNHAVAGWPNRGG